MQTKRVANGLALFLALMMAPAVLASSDEKQVQASTVAQVDPSDFPRVAIDQSRPVRRVKVACQNCPIEPPYDDGGFTPNACNCNRKCTANTVGCTVSNGSTCKADAYGGVCKDCLNSDCP
jgi:hypothetical protein